MNLDLAPVDIPPGLAVVAEPSPSAGSDAAAPRGQLHGVVLQAFDGCGPLARADARFRPRAVQLEMAGAIADAIERREVLVAEAGTGVGKTYAYLVPALLCGGRALISTATKSLQDQLFLRDLPRLRDALQVPATIALLKGRASYLCLHRMQQARQAGTFEDRHAVRALARIEDWSRRTVTGDLAEVDGLDERSSVIPLVTSSRDNCLGAECPEHRQCHVLRARREAMAADVVVVNHHLFFADMALRDSGVAELLPSVDVAVFDEAHQLADAGVQFLGSMLGTSQMLDFARDLLAVGLSQARGLRDWQALSAACERAARELRIACVGPIGEVRGSFKLRWDERAGAEDFTAALADLDAPLSQARQALIDVDEAGPDFGRLAERAQQLAALARAFACDAEPGTVRWIDLSPHQARLVESPLDIRDALAQQMRNSSKAWIFTSATLGDDDRLSWFTESAGLGDATCLRVGSPFDYAAHARLYVPRGFPKPNHPAHGPSVAVLASRLARALGGRTFVLTTTLRALRQIGEALAEELSALDADIQVLVQGQVPKRRLLERFLAEPRSVLVGSHSFWEGIDVPGEALQCVVIDKLPFPPPNDPLVEARVKRLESEGRNAFADYFVAEAAVALKQGAGRLIRSETDRGLLVVCDPRMAGMNYGRRLRNALPPMGNAANEAEALAWLAQLAAPDPQK